MSTLYEDNYLVLDDDALTIKEYYFPFGSKRIPYEQIQHVSVKELGVLSGRFRVWGMDLEPYWYHLDLIRPGKKRGIALDIGQWIKPVLTPKDYDQVFALLQEKTPGKSKRG